MSKGSKSDVQRGANSLSQNIRKQRCKKTKAKAKKQNKKIKIKTREVDWGQIVKDLGSS